jgi:hypothetical protein
LKSDNLLKGAHHVTLAGDDARLQSKFFTPWEWSISSLIYVPEIDQETFEYMWKLSEPGKGDAEGCFMRLKQEELYEEGYGDGVGHNYYPGVSSWKLASSQLHS